jgi:hypothetical protein
LGSDESVTVRSVIKCARLVLLTEPCSSSVVVFEVEGLFGFSVVSVKSWIISLVYAADSVFGRCSDFAAGVSIAFI